LWKLGALPYFLLQLIAHMPGLLPEIELFEDAASGAICALIAGLIVGGFLMLVRRRLLAQLASASHTQN
jgi:hypothetical protein